MPTSVSNKVNTQKQFRKMPERVYQKNLNTPHFGSDYTDRADLEGEQFAKSLGVLGENIWREKVHHETREMNQWTLDKAKAMIAGKTTQDLANLDNIMTLQQASSSFDLTDNRYAMALLDRAVGEQMADNAMQDYLKENEGKVPGSVQEAVEAYSSKVQDAFAQGKGRVMNEEAFRDGLYSNMYVGVNTISDNARKLIKADKQNTGRATVATRMQKLFSHSHDLSTYQLSTKMQELCREFPLYFDTAAQAREGFALLVKDAVDNGTFKDMSALKTLEKLEFYPGHTVGKEIPLGFAYKAVGKQSLRDIVEAIRQKYTKQDGTIDTKKVKEELQAIGIRQRTNTFDLKDVPTCGNNEWDTQIKKMGSKYNIPSGLIYYVIQQESSFNPNHPEHDGGVVGLAQMKRSTAADMGVNPDDPMDSIEGCAKYLNWLYNHDNNTGKTDEEKLQWAIKHYNCGPGTSPENAEALANNSETIAYFNDIWGNYKALKDKPMPEGGIIQPTPVRYEGNEEGDYTPPAWATSLNKPLFNTLPFIMGKLYAMGYKNAVITSGSREPNEAGNAGDRSDHVKHDAIDIWISDDLDEAGLQNVANVFKPYFKQVLGEDPDGDLGRQTDATGKHIHLGGYLGGIDANVQYNDLDYNATAFNGDQVDALLEENERQEAQYKKDRAEMQRQQMNDYAVWKWGANGDAEHTPEEEKEYIRTHLTSIPEGERDKMLGAVDREQKRLAEIAMKKAARNTGAGDSRIAYGTTAGIWYDYYVKGQYAKDYSRVEWLLAKKASEDGLTEAEQKELSKKSDNLSMAQSTGIVDGTEPHQEIGEFCYFFNGHPVSPNGNHITKTAYINTVFNNPNVDPAVMEGYRQRYYQEHPELLGGDDADVDENPDFWNEDKTNNT